MPHPIARIRHQKHKPLEAIRMTFDLDKIGA